jgi:hypothetical protein
LRVRRKGKEMPIPHIVWKGRLSKTPNLGRKALKGFFKIKKKKPIKPFPSYSEKVPKQIEEHLLYKPFLPILNKV